MRCLPHVPFHPPAASSLCIDCSRRVYSKLKYESGVHRVQRVPSTETSGRVHTSTATVAIMPEVDDVDVKIDPKVGGGSFSVGDKVLWGALLCWQTLVRQAGVQRKPNRGGGNLKCCYSTPGPCLPRRTLT